jgi:hypothetical protein
MTVDQLAKEIGDVERGESLGAMLFALQKSGQLVSVPGPPAYWALSVVTLQQLVLPPDAVALLERIADALEQLNHRRPRG